FCASRAELERMSTSSRVNRQPQQAAALISTPRRSAGSATNGAATATNAVGSAGNGNTNALVSKSSGGIAIHSFPKLKTASPDSAASLSSSSSSSSTSTSPTSSSALASAS